MPLEDTTRRATLVDRVASVMMQAWEDAEHEKVNASYVATFADMAKAVVDQFNLKEQSHGRL